MAVHILGIRHHGVGSAKNVAQRLKELQPDLVLVEGPPEISDLLKTIGHTDLQPPVAIMVYNKDLPKQSTFYPFAEYSPEWIAVQYANEYNISVRAMDLTASISFKKRATAPEKILIPEDSKDEDETPLPEVLEAVTYRDPLSYFAEIQGFNTGESWWEYHFEQPKENTSAKEHFEAVMETMITLRNAKIPSHMEEENLQREAYMRQLIRQAQNEMYNNIAIICGAWHAPTLQNLDEQAKADVKFLKKLPKSKIKIAATWIPWTNERLSMFSGYGAGLYSPGWYEHLWSQQEDFEMKWLAKVAGTFRDNKMDISTAHIIEAYRLAQSLSAIRNKSSITLNELNEATQTVMCMGDQILLSLINEQLVVGQKLGQVPDDIPKVPLQEDFEVILKKLRLKLSTAEKQYDLDLRKPMDLKRSILFHRLEILEIQLAKRVRSRNKGTFKDSWVIEWSPEMMVDLIDKSFLGNTIESATQNVIKNKAKESKKVSKIAQLLSLSIPAELFELIDFLLDSISKLSTISMDIIDLMTALPGLVNISRYGNVRNTDLSTIQYIVEQLFIKITIGLPNACYGLDEANSNNMFSLIAEVNNAIRLCEDPKLLSQWHQALQKLLDQDGVHTIIIGCSCRVLLDAGEFTDEEAERQLSFALSMNKDPMKVAAWIEGFLRGSGMILIYDNRLWNLIYAWVKSLDEKLFIEILPFLRRAFSKFEFGERRQIGRKAKTGFATENSTGTTIEKEEFNKKRAQQILPVIRHLLNIK